MENPNVILIMGMFLQIHNKDKYTHTHTCHAKVLL